ncbi:MAG TPA: alpha/beta hydrolase [Nakamurella sp.]
MTTTTTGSRQTGRIAGLAADDFGSSDHRPPLILLHGMTFDRTIWRDIIPELQQIDPGRRVLAIDLPGHGESADQSSYDLDLIVDQIHGVVQEAGLTAPVLVGHSASGGFATAYATRYPARGVVNIDSPLQIAPLITLLRSLGDRLRGPEFSTIWQHVLFPSFHVELLPHAAQELVRTTCRPRPQVALGYWRQLLEGPADEVPAIIEHESATLRASGMPYLYVAGSELDPDYRQWLDTHLPAATVEVWSNTGHFPHLADPHRFVKLLADTALR